MRDDALPLRRVVGAGAAVAVTVALAVGVVVFVLAHRGIPLGGAPVAGPAPLPAGDPMLQSAPQDDLAAYRQEKSRALDSLGWIDTASGIAHIPIDAALDGWLAQAAREPASEASP